MDLQDWRGLRGKYERTPEVRAKQSSFLKGKKKPPRSAEHRANHRASMIGKNKGRILPPRSAEHRAAASAGQRKRWSRPEEHIKHSIVMMASLSSLKVRNKMSASAKIRVNCLGAQERKRIEKIKYWQNPVNRSYNVRATLLGNKVKPNKPEKFLTKLLQKLFPNEWKYVGDGQFILAGKCPDFININGQKKIIELFGDYWHSEEVTGISKEQHEQERVDHFTQYGYQTLVIWECELKDIKSIENKIIDFDSLRA